MKLKIGKKEEASAVFYLKEWGGKILLCFDRIEDDTTRTFNILEIGEDEVIKAWGSTTLKWNLSCLEDDEIDDGGDS
jgi:hypothetical protein